MAQPNVHLAESFTDPPNYSFPHHRLNRTLRDPNKTPIVLVACGSFSPVTYLHLRMFEMAKDYVRQNTDFEIVGAYLSPVSDQYKKPGLLSARHRCVRCPPLSLLFSPSFPHSVSMAHPSFALFRGARLLI